MNSNTIILLANGKGTRFKSNFNDIPKPLIKYKDEELITWSLKALKTIIPKSWDKTIVVSRYASVREFIKLCFKYVGIELEFKGEGVNEKGYVKSCNDGNFNLKVGKEVIGVDKNFFRPTDVDELRGDASKARRELKWKPKTSFKQLVKEMMVSDLKEIW